MIKDKQLFGSMATIKDEQFFTDHPDRQARIREPGIVLVKNAQRGTYYAPECGQEFQSLGEHEKSRRRILVWRVPKDNAHYNPKAPQLIVLPFLLFADETVADEDAVLLPIIHEIMEEARSRLEFSREAVE